MTIPRPILDDRSYEQLRDELVQRIPVYTPEWTDHNPSDPGITLIELFAFLGENLLFRFNQIPEATRLAYLRLLQIPLRSARPARTLVTLATTVPQGVPVPRETVARAGDLGFEIATETRVLPVRAQAVSKASCPTPDPELEPEVFAFFARSIDALDGLEGDENPQCYENQQLMPEEDGGQPVDFDQAVDGMLWVAIMAEDDGAPADHRRRLAEHADAPVHLNLGFVPDLAAPPASETLPCPGDGIEPSGPAVEWQVATGLRDANDQPIYRSLAVAGDTTRGMTREGVLRLRLPRGEQPFGTFDIADPDRAGTGALPPSLDEETEAKLLFWLRAYRHDGSRFGRVRFLGANAAEAVQQTRARPELLGTGNGQAGQQFRLVHPPVVADSLSLQVEETGQWRDWRSVEGFFASGESDRHYVLDPGTGDVRFGNGIQGRVPQIGERIRVTAYRYGGGTVGNVAAGAIQALAVDKVTVTNPLPAYGGADSEPVAEALERIPGELRRRDRAVTKGDFRELAKATPGADVGRAECLPRFHPATRSTEAAGVVTVVVWPRADAAHPDAPMPDRNLLRAVCAWLDARRLVTTELYVVPPVYRRIAVSVGLAVQPGYGIEAVRHWVELVVRQYLAPLPPYGPAGDGWPLGRRVHGPELEAAALQVEGVEFLEGLRVAAWNEGTASWDEAVVSGPGDSGAGCPTATVTLALDEVPELAAVTVIEGPPEEPGAGIEPELTGTPVPIPVIREVC